MRDIIFRGKRVDNKEWIEGFLWSQRTIGYTTPIGNTDEIVIEPETVGQYTGLTDNNGKRIFEGDIVKSNFFGKDDGNGHNFADHDKFAIKWNNCGFVITNRLREFGIYKSDSSIEIIGNIYDNPELLE